MTIGIKSRQFTWEPETDITIYEIAMALPIFFIAIGGGGHDVGVLVDKLPDEVRRHFTEA